MLRLFRWSSISVFLLYTSLASSYAAQVSDSVRVWDVFELEMTAEDQSDYERFKKMLDRLGKAVIMSAEAETSEIIRRRLTEPLPHAADDRPDLAVVVTHGPR